MDGLSGRSRRSKVGLSRAYFALVVVVTIFVHRTESNEVCRTGCHGTQQTFKYDVGTTYKYDYEGKIDIILSSAEGQSTSTEVKAQVLLTQLPECNQLLKLQNLQVLDSKGKKLGSIPDIEKPIKINFHDGHIEDSICIEDGDNQNSINIKRAIASMFQADLKSSYETDVFGRCPTDTSSHKEGNILVITKSRGLNKCAFREHVQQDFLASTFNIHSEIKSSPILNGVYGAKLRVKNGVLEQAIVTEDYLYVPFSVGNNGAKAKITSKLQLTGNGKDAPTGAPSKPRSLIFDNPHPLVAPGSNAKNVFDAVKKASESIDLVVGEESAKEFVKLIKTVRVTNKDDLLLVYNQVRTGADLKNKDTARRLYLDALLRSGNAGSVEAVIELLTKNELDQIEQKVAYMGLNFVRHANEGCLKSAISLLSNPKLAREAYLGIGNLLNKYCRQHSCENFQPAQQLSNALLAKLAQAPKNREQENDAVYALKALGNIEHLNDNVVKKVVAIAQDKKAASRLRVAALETFLADPCKVRDNALHILQDIQQDSEIRIKAYLALAKCPTAKIANALKTLLEKEPSIQVGGFILAHIRNIRNSVNPDKGLAQQHLGNLKVQKRFPIDPRKWSFNSEFSYTIDTLGIGANTESNVIYSQNSWLPRSSSLNLTAEIFGHNFNFLEIQTRQENLDKVVEHYLGPKGILRTSLPKNVLDKGYANLDKLGKMVEEKLKTVMQSRSKRDVSKAEMDHIAKQINLRTNELNKDLDLDLSVKVFGAEVAFLNLYTAEKITPEAIIDRFVRDLAKGLDKLQNFDETIRTNLLFLDAEIDYPTSLGFPLRLAVEGSATTQLKAKGAIDVRRLLNKDENGEIKAKILPSANIEISGRLTLDALVVENGLKVASSLYTSLGADVALKYSKNSIDLKFGLPVQEQKLISLNHEIVFHARDQSGKEENAPLKFTQVKDWSICIDQLSEFIGLTFCGEVNGPNTGGQVPVLPYPFAGDAKLAVSIENEDVKEYRIRHNLIFEEGQQGADWTFETIALNGQRKVAVELKGELLPEKYLTAAFISNTRKASAELRIIDNNQMKAIQAKAALDNEVYEAKLGVAISGSPDKYIYKPILEYITPQGSQQLPIKVEGQIIAELSHNNFKYKFDQVKLVTDVQAIGINGELGKDDGGLFTDLVIADQKDSAKINGRLQATEGLLKVNAEVQNTINPELNFNIKGQVLRAVNEVELALQIIHGPDLSSKINILTLNSKFLKKFESSDDFRVETRNKFSYPLIGVNAKLEYEQTPKTVDYDVMIQYGDFKVGSELEAKYHEKQKGDYQVEFEIFAMDNKFELKANRKGLGNDESQIHHVLEINDKKFEIEGKVKHLIRPQHVFLVAEVELKIPTHNNAIKINSGLKVTPEELDVHHLVGSGSEVWVDGFLKADNNGDANGNLKVNIKNFVTVQGQIKAKGGAGSADVLIDVQNGKRQVKAESTFKIQPPHVYDLAVNLYPAYNKDKNLKISLDTANKISEDELITKNSLNILGNPLEFNAKMAKQGTPQNGKMECDVELTLPSDQYFLAKINSDNKEANNLLAGQCQGGFEYRKNKNAPGRRVSYKSTWKNTNPKEGLIDLTGIVSADDSNGQNINLEVALARKKEGNDLFHVISNNKLYGSLLKNPLQGSFESKYTADSADYSAIGSCGNNNVEVKGAYNLESPSKPTSGNVEIQVQTTNKVLKVLKVNLSGGIARPDKDRKFLVQGAASIYADSADSNIVDVKTQGEVIASPLDGSVKGSLALGKVEPISVSGSYNLKENNGNHDVTGTASVSYGQGKEVKATGELHRTSDHHYKLKGAIQSPIEGYKNAQLSVETKRIKNEKIDSTAELILDGLTYKLDTLLVLNELAPVVDLKLTCPQGMKEIYVKGHGESNKQFGGEIRLQDTERNFKLEGGLNVNMNSPDDFVIKANLNSPALKVDRAVFEAKNKQEGNERKVAVSLNVADKNVISGSTNYKSHQENGRFIIEGSGNFKVREESQNGNFKVILDQLTQEKDGEIGSELHFISSIGKRGFDSEFKASNKHFRIQTSYCEEKKTCANIEIDNKINANEVHNFNQVLTISADLRKFGLTHEFGIKSATSRKDFVIDYTLNAHLENDEKSKYQLSIAMHPKNGHLTMHTPKRIVSLEGKVNYPEHIKNGGKGEGEIVFYIDKKNHADKKTALTWNVNVDPQARKISGETKFTHPGLPKPLLVSFTATRTGTPYNGELQIQSEVDIFAQPNQKVIASYHQKVNINDERTVGESKIALDVKSTGLKIDIAYAENIKADRNAKSISYEETLNYHVGGSKYENVVSGSISPTKLDALLKVLNTVLLKVSSKATIKDKEQIWDTELTTYDNNPLVGRMDIKNYNTLFYTVGYKKTPNERLNLNAALIPGQIADLRADHLTGNTKHNLFRATLKLDEANFLKPDYNIDSQETEKIMMSLNEEQQKLLQGLEKLAKEWIENAKTESQHLGELARKAAPNLNPLKNYYTKEFKEIKDEILNDKSLKELGEAIRKILDTILSSYAEIFQQIDHLLEEATKTIGNSVKSVLESLEKELLPLLKEVAGKLAAVVKDIFSIASEIVLGVVSKAIKIAEQYQPELKELAQTVGELSQNVGRFLQDTYVSLRENIISLVKRINEEIRASPMYEDMRQYYEQFLREGIPSADAVLNTITEVFNTIKDTIPIDFFVRNEIVELLDTVTDYMDKKLHGKSVDDIAVFEKLGKTLAIILRKLTTLVSFEEYGVGVAGLPDQAKLQNQLPLNYLKNLPNLVAAKFSPLNFILKEYIGGEIMELLLSLVNRPRNLVAPFPLFGQIVQGQHIFTFGGNYYTLPGNCNYLFARDAVNGNFTLAGTYKEGQLQAITLADETDSVTLQKGGQVKLNKAVVELPTRKPNLAAYRTYGTVNLVSTAGVYVVCTPDLIACEVHISGFYHGQVRGLLGVGNNEPFNDFTLPNGKIVTSENDFANTYKMKAACADVKVNAETGAENPNCNKLFSWESSMRYCYPFVNPYNFKQACSHGLANGVKNTEYALAAAYVAACQNRNIPISVPQELLKCTNSEKPYSVGEQFSVKLPSKAADVILLVDTLKENEEIYKHLVQPLVQDIGEELRTKGVNDVEFHLITYGGENQWPSHVTMKGKLTFKGQAPPVKFSEESKDEEEEILKKISNSNVRRFGEALKSLVSDVSLVTGNNLRANTYEEGLHYPFRAHALKSIVVFTSRSCEIGRFYPLQKLASLLYKNNLLSVHLFTPFESLSAKDAKKSKDIVGFNGHNVFTLSQGKKNPKGTAELHKELSYDDYCVDFVINNRGNAFSTTNFLAHKSEQKQFVKIAATNIVDQLVNVEQGLDCECKIISPWSAQNVCEEAFSKERSSKKV